ncbi:hypothetical protein J1614_009760 [Plenodomus biglobosus]|nr:hypothetical protein J1614_009760 [Plenodomus biglobosus]
MPTVAVALPGRASVQACGCGYYASPDFGWPYPNLSLVRTVLIFARDTASAENGAALGLRGYGIPYEIALVPQAGVSNLPLLNSSATHGNYGGIVMISEVGYNYDNQYYSALTRRQWNDLYAYQSNFGVRMVRLDVYPTSDFGVSSLGGNLNDEPVPLGLSVSLEECTWHKTNNVPSNVGISIANIFHSPATITNSSIAWEVAKFSTAGTAAVINRIGDRQQMVWFMPFALDWAAPSNIIQHSWITWLTRGLFVGFRRIYLSTQVDDMFLETPMYRPQGQNYRAKPDDLSFHVDWQATLNSKMPRGSEFFIEIGHNGNGDIEAATDTTEGERTCSPSTAIEYADQPDGSPDSHADLTNATYSDTAKEISFNQAWLKQVGLDAALRFSPKGIIPPAITGLYNADAIKGWMDNGIVNVVGDNTRPLLRNTQNVFWPLTTTVAGNGYAGLIVMPRWATIIYYNCDLPACTLQEWIDTSAGSGTFDDLLANARDTAIRNLMGLHWDP